jgi:uncharacterized protein (TIGR02687 family)
MNCEKIIQLLQKKRNEVESPKGTAPDERIIMFWYDPEQSFVDCLDSLSLICKRNGREAKVLHHTSYFKTKYLLEHEDQTSNFLVYMPCENPSDMGQHHLNRLIDIETYAERFRADELSLYMEECQINNYSVYDTLKSSLDFFKNRERRSKFVVHFVESNVSDDDITEYKDMIHKCMITTVVGSAKVDLEDVLIWILAKWLDEEDNQLWNQIEKMWLASVFWQWCEQSLWYSGNQEFLSLWKSLIFSAMSYETKSNTWIGENSKYVVLSGSLATRYLQNWIKRADYNSIYTNLLESTESQLQLDEYANKIASEYEIRSYWTVLPFFDKCALRYCLQVLQQEHISDPHHITAIIERRKHISLWFADYCHSYWAFSTLVDLLSKISVYEKILSNWSSTISLWDAYQTQLYEIDQLYRTWLFYYDKTKHQEAFKQLSENIENRYAYWVRKLNTNRNDMLIHEGVIDKRSLPWIKSQQNFRIDTVKKNTAVDAKFTKAIVIISDGLRFEVAQELSDRLRQEARWDVLLETMLGVIPSYTQLGMASLLPQTKLTFNENHQTKTVMVDNILSSWIENRKRLLSSANAKATAIKWSDLDQMKVKEEQVPFMREYDIVYIYHDVIDSAWEKDEHSIPEMANKAIEELQVIIKRCSDTFNFSQIFVTADHGFLYNRWKLEVSDLASRVNSKDVLIDWKRFWFSADKEENQININMGYLWMNNLYCFSPKADLRYQKQWKVPQYIHWWASLQEVCVPLIVYHHKKAGTQKNDQFWIYTTLQLISKPRIITTNEFILTFFQPDPITEKMKNAEYTIWLRNDSSGKKVSNIKTINANIDAYDAQQRTRKERFQLVSDPSERYDQSVNYSIIMQPVSEKMWLPIIEPIKISIGIRNDFF